MNTLSRVTHLIDPVASFFDNRMNALLVRELRQLVRNRFIIIMLNLYIGILALVCLLNVSFAADEYMYNNASGVTLFYWIAGIMGTVGFLIVIPYTALVTAMERINNDLMFTSAIRPSSIVLGKFMNGLILSLLLFSVTLPFFTVANQLRGLDMFTAIGNVWLTFLNLQLTIAVVILLFTAVRTYVQLVMMSIGAIIGSIMLLQGFFFMLAMRGGGFLFGGDYTWWGLLWMTLFYAILIAVFLSAAIINVAAPTTNRFMPFRITTTLAFIFSFAVCAYLSFDLSAPDLMKTWSLVALWSLLPILLLTICDRDEYSPRLRNLLPRSPVYRFLIFPFHTGAVNGMLWASLLAVIIFLTSGLFIPEVFMTGSYTQDDYNVFFLILFLFDYCFTAILLQKWLLGRWIPRGMTWLLVGLLLTFFVTGGLLLHFVVESTSDNYGWANYDESVFAATNPILLFNDFHQEHRIQSLCALVWAVALVPLILIWAIPILWTFTPKMALQEHPNATDSADHSLPPSDSETAPPCDV